MVSTSLNGGIWHIAREYGGIAEAGGIKDVVAGLAESQAREGRPVTVVLLRYGFINLENLAARSLPLTMTLKLPGQNEPSPSTPVRVEIYRCERQGLRIFLLDSARTRSKGAVYTYTVQEEQEDPARKRGTGHRDAHHLNLILQRGALELAYRF